MNIVLLGFKSSGKSTLGKELAVQLGYTFVDTDTLLENLYKKEHEESLDCRDIYTKHGALYMRELETRAVTGLSCTTHTVVATGGGIVLCKETMLFLQNYGLCVFLDVVLPVLKTRLRGVNSPLFAQKSIAELYAERYALYVANAKVQFTVAENVPVIQLAQQLRERIEKIGLF